MYLYKYNQRTGDGTLLFEIDTRMADVIESITISNRKRFGKKVFTTYVAERDYQYAGKAGFVIRVQLASMRKMIGRFSDTATVDITVYEAGRTVGWKRSMVLNKKKLRTTHYIRFR
jgi:CTP synthase (UTP-ammonia lyase)